MGGTLNVLESCAKSASIKRVVLTSSIAAVAYKEVEANHVFTDKDWSDEDLLRRQEMWYMLRCAGAGQGVWCIAALGHVTDTAVLRVACSCWV